VYFVGRWIFTVTKTICSSLNRSNPIGAVGKDFPSKTKPQLKRAGAKDVKDAVYQAGINRRGAAIP
jgi:hypothetical protein